MIATAAMTRKPGLVGRPRIRQVDIAREAEVSIATVDRVLNARAGVNVHTARRIWDAVKRLETRRDHAATGRPQSLRFDFVLPAGTNTFMAMLETAIGAAGRRLAETGVAVRCHRIEGFNAAVLAESILDIGPRSDGLAVVALENPMVREAVNEVCDLGIPVITLVSNLTTRKKLGYVGLDNRAAGRTAGYLMGRFLRRRSGSVAVLEGSLALSYRDHQEREFGFRDAVKEYAPELAIGSRWETQDNFEESFRQTLRMLDAEADLLGLYSIGSGVRGIVHALKQRGVARDIVVIGHDLTRYTRQFLIDGSLDAIIDQNPAAQADLAVATLLAKHEGGTVSPPPPVKVEVIFRENLP